MIKRFFIISFVVGCSAVFLCGCTEGGPATRQKTTEPKTREPGIIDYMTGSQQIKVYQKTKSKLEDIQKTQEKKYNEFLD